uniref:Diagnostic antigen gp50 n=1 Tax=Echinococcus granulosus TaxID=6210 RepID=A0A068X2I6_ECHGR|nr:diagnostic antigen gp50 [Echinococcus granulosus]
MTNAWSIIQFGAVYAERMNSMCRRGFHSHALSRAKSPIKLILQLVEQPMLLFNFAADMKINETSNLRVFRAKFPIRSNVEGGSIFRGNNSSLLTVTVDFTQNGTSPEVAECNQYWEAQRTTSSGPALVHTITVVLESMLVVTLLTM